MASTVGWLVFGMLALAFAVWLSFALGVIFRDPERIVAFGRAGAIQGRITSDPDARRGGMRWPVVVVPAVWCVALLTWPRTVDHLMRKEWNVVTSGAESSWANLAFGLLLLGLMLSVVFGITIHYWNRPKLLVHPYFRDDPGVLKARRLRAEGVDVDALYEGSAERWRGRRGRGSV